MNRKQFLGMLGLGGVVGAFRKGAHSLPQGDAAPTEPLLPVRRTCSDWGEVEQDLRNPGFEPSHHTEYDWPMTPTWRGY